MKSTRPRHPRAVQFQAQLQLGDLRALNIGKCPTGESGIPMATVLDAVVEVQAASRQLCCRLLQDGGCRHALDAPQQGHDVVPMPAQAHQRNSPVPAKAAYGGPNSGAIASRCTSPDGENLGAAVAGDSADAALSRSSVLVQEEESGAAFSRLQKSRYSHTEKGRMRRTRLKNSWAFLRHVGPGLSENSDNASVRERVAEYKPHRNQTLSATFKLNRMKKIIQEFLDKFQPY